MDCFPFKTGKLYLDVTVLTSDVHSFLHKKKRNCKLTIECQCMLVNVAASYQRCTVVDYHSLLPLMKWLVLRTAQSLCV